ncbi:hypothetical protein [Streptomyces mirabilis]|uniref:hypothetical protein n=1 Tax=Streptomyces mirabilis TaxID=68239 RepID=UPI0036D8AB67
MTCRTPEEAFRAGLAAPCQHGIHPKRECPDCALTAAEIAQLAPLLRPYVPPAHRDEAA